MAVHWRVYFVTTRHWLEFSFFVLPKRKSALVHSAQGRLSGKLLPGRAALIYLYNRS